MKSLIVLFCALFGCATLMAQSPEDAVIEQDRRTDAISRTLRCVVCQNQSIYESNAPLAEDMRRLVRKRVEAGDSDADVRRYLRDRYGDYVLLSPPFQPNTWGLWLAPGLLVMALGIWFVVGRRQTGNAAPGAGDMSSQDRARVQAFLSQTQEDKT